MACHTTMKTLFILHLCCISFIHTEQVELDSKPESLSDGASTSVVLKQSSSTGSNHCFFPCLEFLELYHCRGLTEVANLPPSIKTLNIFDCGSLVSVSGEVPSLEKFEIKWCDGLTEVANLPPSIKTLNIDYCGSLVSVSGEVPSLEKLEIWSCESLESLPNGPAHQAYSSLRVLRITQCPGIKQLPPSLQQRLDHLREKTLDPHLFQGNLYLISWFHFN